MEGELHNKFINNYREVKREGDQLYDEFEAKHFTPLSRSEHNFHDIRKDESYKEQRKIHTSHESDTKK